MVESGMLAPRRDLASLGEEKYRVLVEAITDCALYMVDPFGHIVSWNSGAERLKGYKEGEVLGKPFSIFYTEDERSAGIPHRALEIAGSEGRFETEGWRVRKDGSRFWAHVVIDPIFDADGRVLGFAKIIRDFTERRATTEALAESEQRFRILVQGIADYAIYMLDPMGRVSSWNAGAERFKGYASEEVIGTHFSRFYPLEDQQSGLPLRALKTAQIEGRFESEGWRVRKDGSRFWAHVIIDAIRHQNGKLLGFAKITRDLTDRKRAEANLAEAQGRLAQAQKLEALGQLTSGIAHDFNNLLTVVLGSLEILRKRLPNNPELIKPLDNAVAGAERGATLTQRLLAFARKQDLAIEAVDVIQLLNGMPQLLQTSAGSSINVEIRVPSKCQRAHTDPTQLELAILNLAVNARDAMPDGGKITISAREEALTVDNKVGVPTGNYVCIAVTDTGCGMDKETLARAVEPFFTTKGVGQGTGLGLAMVHGLAAQSGGGIRLVSDLGKGTTAEIWLPVALRHE